jgi:hypothetical protein
VRLENLAVAASAAATKTPADACDEAAIDDNLAALQALRIVDVKGLLEAQPENNPQCYNLPCPSDVEAAKATTCERAGRLANIVKASTGL